MFIDGGQVTSMSGGVHMHHGTFDCSLPGGRVLAMCCIKKILKIATQIQKGVAVFATKKAPNLPCVALQNATQN